MDKPIRIQRRRVKGWKMPPNTVSVTRGTQFGNPFRVGGRYKWGGLTKSGIDALMIYMEAGIPDERFALIETNEQAVEWFRKYITEHFKELGERAKRELRGKNLACFCPLDRPCHADVLLEIANQ